MGSIVGGVRIRGSRGEATVKALVIQVSMEI
ncbi:hypothetical protein Igag_0677 [Ignisphaera aggregans DSM 17230]|uniref:Uncharacterized protein n=1 Tax=Ignisphaera aggregans (strain DSM 17230 / JCM 13409 / AQ1.S1) TaxID=583356 RepID=E0SSV7_IGNAA|nr:hypothetical protein Igag_0677 [Ignisphaera aggregans DSM 17230]